MSWKVLITARTFNDVGGPALDALRAAGCEIILPSKMGPLNATELTGMLEGVDAVIASPDAFTAAVLKSPVASKLKVISRWGVGYDSIDIPAATELGIAVAYTPGMLDDTVADYTFALLMALARRLADGHIIMREGQWKMVWGSEISGKTLGIVGCGRIGQAVARRATGFSMRILGYDVATPPAAEQLGIQMVPLPDLLAQSDFVTLHAALTPSSRGLIGEEQLKRMKPTAYLINAGRGALVDETALARALQDGQIAGAALDTFVQEPLPPDHPFRGAPNVLLTPHLASFARETGERVSLAAAQAVIDLMQHRKPRALVNPDVLNAPNLRAPIH